LLSTFVYIIAFLNLNWTFTNVAFNVWSFCNSLTQVMICYIFWNMDNIQFVPMPVAKQTADEEVA
jgi:hypothetical protein